MKFNRLPLACAAAIGLALSTAHAENWPQWRGPFFNGSTTEKHLPATWDKTNNVSWVCRLPGLSGATPAIWGDSVFVSSPDEQKNLLLLCIDRTSGKIRWQKQVASGDRAKESKNNMASPSPVTDGQTVWIMYGTGDLAAYDFAGKELWKRNLCTEYGKFSILWLYGSSPLLYQGRLYVQVLQSNPPRRDAQDDKPERDSYLLCLDPKTGKNLWRHVRKTDAIEESMEAFSTPIPSEINGRSEILIVGGDYVTAHDPATGAELWRAGGLNTKKNPGVWRIVPSPVAASGMVIACAPKRDPVFAFKDGGKGDVSKSHLAWTFKEFPSDCTTPLFYDGKLFVFDGDKRMMNCLDPKTGSVLWQRQIAVPEVFRGSPTGADGKIYCLSVRSTVAVLDAKDGKVLSVVTLDEGPSHSSIAAADGSLFVRTAQNLYCISAKKP